VIISTPYEFRIWTLCTAIFIGFELKTCSIRQTIFTLHSSFLGVAFLLMDVKECIMSAEEVFLTKIEKFINIHRNSFLVLSAALHGPEEWKLMFRIQQRYRKIALQIYFSYTALCLLQFLVHLTVKCCFTRR
jgi:hypothetical protein